MCSLKQLPAFFCCLCMLFYTNCKRVTKQLDAEKPYTVYFTRSDGTPIDTCFDRVYGNNRPAVNGCTYLTKGIELPLNMAADSCIFYFKQDTVVKTLKLRYKRVMERGKDSFQQKFTGFQVVTDLGKVNGKCIKDLTFECNGDDAYYSMAITE